MSLKVMACYNGLPIGGPYASIYGLLSYSDRANNGSRVVSMSISVKGPPRETYRQLLLNNCVNRKSLTLATYDTSQGSGQVQVSLSGDDVKLTASGNFFSPSDLGNILYLSDQGKAVQLSEIISSTVAKAKTFSGSTFAPFGTGSGFTTAYQLSNIVKCNDYFGTVDASDSPLVEGDKVGGIDCIVEVGRPGDPEDEDSREKVEISFSFVRPYQEVYPSEGGRVDASIEVSTDTAGLTAVVFTGKIVAGTISGVGYLVRGILSQAVDSWIDANLDAIDSSATFEEGPRYEKIDADGRSMTFRRSYTQQLIGDTSTDFDDPRIKGAAYSFKRSYQAIHGWISGIQPFTVEASYSASIKAYGSGALTQETIYNFWRTTLKRYLKLKVETIFNGKVSIMSGVDPVYEPATGKISASILCFVRNSGTSVYRYNQDVAIQDEEGIEAVRRFTGEDYSAYDFLNGKSMMGTVAITITTLGDPVDAKTNQGSDQLSGSGVVEIQGAALAINLPSRSNPGANVNNEKITIFPDPGDPSRVFPEVVSGFWRRISRGYRENVTYFGADPDGIGDRIKVSACVYLGVFAWRAESSGPPGSIDREADRVLDAGDGVSSIPHGGL